MLPEFAMDVLAPSSLAAEERDHPQKAGAPEMGKEVPLFEPSGEI